MYETKNVLIYLFFFSVVSFAFGFVIGQQMRTNAQDCLEIANQENQAFEDKTQNEIKKNNSNITEPNEEDPELFELQVKLDNLKNEHKLENGGISSEGARLMDEERNEYIKKVLSERSKSNTQPVNEK